MFYKLYRHYKNDFDFEMKLRASNKTYAQIEAKAEREQEWF